MLLQLSHFTPLFNPLCLAHPIPPSSSPFSSCPQVIHISSLTSTFPTLFLPSPCLFSTYHLCYLFSVRFPLSHPPTPLLTTLHVISISMVLFLFQLFAQFALVLFQVWLLITEFAVIFTVHIKKKDIFILKQSSYNQYRWQPHSHINIVLILFILSRPGKNGSYTSSCLWAGISEPLLITSEGLFELN